MAGFAPVASTERIAAIQDGEPDPLGKITKLVTRQYSERFLRAVSWMLAPNAKDRPQTVHEALAGFGSDGPQTVVSPAAHDRPSTEIPETQHIDQLADTQATWQPGVLNTVELNLEQYIGPLSKALVKKASKKAANIEELTELLSRFIPSEKAKTGFLAKTQILGETEILPAAAEPVDAVLKPQMPADISEPSQPSVRSRPSIRSRPSVPSKPTAPSTPSTPSQPVSAIDEATFRLAEESLAVYVGPMARILVKKAAKRTSDLEEFYKILAKELPTEEQRNAFRKAVDKSPWR
jgi:serine/threonine-protein kinase